MAQIHLIAGVTHIKVIQSVERRRRGISTLIIMSRYTTKSNFIGHSLKLLKIIKIPSGLRSDEPGNHDIRYKLSIICANYSHGLEQSVYIFLNLFLRPQYRRPLPQHNPTRPWKPLACHKVQME